jgi:hypothetical protein
MLYSGIILTGHLFFLTAAFPHLPVSGAIFQIIKQIPQIRFTCGGQTLANTRSRECFVAKKLT